MSTRESDGVAIESLVLKEPGAGLLVLSGTLTSSAAQAELSGHFERIQQAIVAAKMPAFTVDVRDLSLVSSSAIRLFVSWIARAEVAAYRLVFLIDRTVTWHRLSFSVLQSLAPRTVEVVDRGAAATGAAP